MTDTESPGPGRSPSPDGLDQERILRRIPVKILAVSAFLALGAVIVFDWQTGLVFFAGGALSALGFDWLNRSFTRFLQRGRRGAMKTGVLMYLLRLLLICLAFSIIILLFPRRILAFGAGFSVLVPVFLVEGVRAFLRMRTWKS